MKHNHLNKKKHARRKQRNNFLKKMSIFVLTVVMLFLPIQTSFNGLNLLGIDSNIAHAQSLKDVNLLERTSIHAGMKGTMGDNTFSVNFSGPIAPNINLIKSDNVINYHLDLSEVPDGVREKIELTSIEDGHVTVAFDPISLSLISIELQDSFNFLSESIQSSTIKVLGFIDRIMDNKFFRFFVTIEGMREYLQAFDEFNKLQNRPQHIPDYTGNLPVFVDNDTNTVSIEFTDELNNHVTMSLEDRVLRVTNTFTDSIKNINIEILPNVPFLNKLSVLVNGIYTILTEITENVNNHILGPIADGVLDATNLSNEVTIKGQMNATTTLQFNKAIGICEGTESVGHGTFPVTVRGLAANQLVTGPDLFYDLNAADDVTIIVLPHENCLMESMKSSTTNFGDRFDIGGIKGLDRLIDPSELILIEEEIEENNEAEKEFDPDAAKDFARGMKKDRREAEEDNKPQIDRDNEGRGTTQQRTDSGKDAQDETDEDAEDKDVDAQPGKDADGKAGDDAKAGGDAGDKAGDAGDGTQDASGSDSESSTNIDIDMDDIEEGIGLLQRLLEIIMKILEAITNK